MRTLTLSVLISLFLSAASPAGAQSIQTDGNVKTDAQLVSNVATGTAPLAVSSTTLVPNLNADSLDGLDFLFFAFFTEFQANQAAIAAHNPDPPCFNDTHRFADCGNGTVTDTVTGVIWLEDAGCLPLQTYAAANATAAALFDGATIDPSASDCGLTDGSRLGDWRLPTKEEWEAIVAPACTIDPEIVGNGSPTPGCYSDSAWAANVQPSAFYWSSTTSAGSTGNAWDVSMGNGLVSNLSLKTFALYVWPVRVGQ